MWHSVFSRLAVATLRRLRTLALIPRIFIKSDRGGTVPRSEPGNLRTAFAVARSPARKATPPAGQVCSARACGMYPSESQRPHSRGRAALA